MNKIKRSIIIFWIVLLSPIVALTIIFTLISFDVFGPMPSFEELENPQNNIATEIISEDNVILGTYYYQNRSFVKREDIAPELFNALIATEDIRFNKHSGIDFRGLARVLFKTVLLGSESSGGGSTISQQLAKNLFPRDTTEYNFFLSRKWALVIAKFKEWQTAIKLERNYTKEEIIVMYLNTVDYGSNSFGIKTASKTYFGKSPDSLKIEECALLVGLLKAPTRYSPVINPERSLNRRNVVLSQMQKYSFLSKEKYDSISAIPINLNYSAQGHNEGLATYFRERLRVMMTVQKPERRQYSSYDQFVFDSIEWQRNPIYGWCNKHQKPDGTPYNIYTDGLKLYTTINAKMQVYAEEALINHLKNELQPKLFLEKKNELYRPFSFTGEPEMVMEIYKNMMERFIRQSDRYRTLKNEGVSWNEIMKNFKKKTRMKVFSWRGEIDTVMSPYDSIKYYKTYLRASFMAMDPQNGQVKAYVGGPNYRYFKYDQVMQGKRQVGSTIKPFVYTLAMQEGYTPCTQVPNIPVTFDLGDSTWTPKNSGRDEYEGKMVTLKFGLAHSLNYISAWVMKQYNPPSVIDIMRKLGITSQLRPVPSLVLGTPDISLYEMVGAYSAYANKGVFVKPLFVTRIEDKNGNVLQTFIPEKTEAISEQTAYLMVKLMQGVINGGTGSRLRYKYNLDNEIAGKTGTTQNHSDGWFVGFTPELVGGVWVGAEDRAVHFSGIDMGQGATMALPIWAEFYQKIYNDKKLNFRKGSFETPPGYSVDFNCDNSDPILDNIQENSHIEF